MKKNLLKTLLVAVGLCVGSMSAWAYDTPEGYKVGTVYLGTEVNNQVLAETFANYTLNTDLTSLSTNWSSNVSGTAGYYWAKIKNTVTALYSGENGNMIPYRDFQTVFDATGYEVTAGGTDYQIPSYVYGKCISLQHRNKDEYHLDYTLPSAISTGRLVFGADFYRIQNANNPVYIQFYDSDENLVFQIYYNNGSGRQTMYYQVGTNDAVGGAGYSEYRTYRGWGIKDMVFDMDAGKVSYSVDNVYWDGSTAAQRRKVSQSSIDFGTGKNIRKVRFSCTGGASKTNYDLFVDNMYLYTLIEGTATTDDVTIIGSKDYEDGYLGSTSSDYVIKPNGKLHLKFKNYGSGAYNWNNWIVLFNNADKSSNLAYIRSDAWELVSSSNSGITTSSNYWDDYQTDLYGSTVEMDIARNDGNVNLVATITTTSSKDMTLTFNKAIGNAAEDIVFRLSEEAACLVLDNTKSALVAPPTFSQTGITNTGNPIITVTENTGDSPTSGSAMYYTINGDTPTASSTGYADPVIVTGGSTIKAITVVTAKDGTTTLTSNAGLLTTTAYIAGQTYDLSDATVAEITDEGFTLSSSSVNYGVGSTARYSINDGKSTLSIMNGLRTGYSGSSETYWYWMVGQGIWQSGGTRSVTLNSTLEGEVALYTLYDCRHDGSNWSYTESENYESDCSYTLNKSNNGTSSGNHVYMVKKVQSFVPVGSTISKSIPTTSTYGTIASAYALDCANLPSGLEAYKVTSTTTTAVVIEQVKTAVAAGTGLILKGTAGETYDIPVVASGTDISATNLLQAAVTATDIEANEAYILQGGQFHLVNAASTVPAGKAYLLASNVPSSAPALMFVFADDMQTTGVNAVKGEGFTVNGYYDLQGRKVANPTKGLYIMNGKKVMVK